MAETTHCSILLFCSPIPPPFFLSEKFVPRQVGVETWRRLTVGYHSQSGLKGRLSTWGNGVTFRVPAGWRAVLRAKLGSSSAPQEALWSLGSHWNTGLGSTNLSGPLGGVGRVAGRLGSAGTISWSVSMHCSRRVVAGQSESLHGRWVPLKCVSQEQKWEAGWPSDVALNHAVSGLCSFGWSSHKATQI